LQVMRSILALFVVAALGFLIILHKKDAPQETVWETQTRELAKVSHNWTKHPLDTSRSIAKNVPNQRQGNEVP
jgi:hypothetical protein